MTILAFGFTLPEKEARILISKCARETAVDHIITNDGDRIEIFYKLIKEKGVVLFTIAPLIERSLTDEVSTPVETPALLRKLDSLWSSAPSDKRGAMHFQMF